MGLFGFFKKKPTASISHCHSPLSENDDVAAIMGRPLTDARSLLFYRKQFGGKAEGGVEWVVLTLDDTMCRAAYKQVCENSSGLPSLERIQTEENTIPIDEMISWDHAQMLSFINRSFHLNLTAADCAAQETYYVWSDRSQRTICRKVVIYQRPLSSCHGDIEPTDFVITQYTNRAEIVWGVGWCGGTSHADGAGGREMLEVTYFQHHTIDDFLQLLQTKSWAKDFLIWFDLKNHEELAALFHDRE